MQQSSYKYPLLIRIGIMGMLPLVTWIPLILVFLFFSGFGSKVHAQISIMDLLTQVNRQVNQMIVPRENNPSNGSYPWKRVFAVKAGDPESQEAARVAVNHWQYQTQEERGDAFGNCKTYAATKRARLISLGVPDSALSIWVVRPRRYSNEYHAVLQVRVQEKDGFHFLILDNLSPWIKERNELEKYGEYTFIEPIEL